MKILTSTLSAILVFFVALLLFNISPPVLYDNIFLGIVATAVVFTIPSLIVAFAAILGLSTLLVALIGFFQNEVNKEDLRSAAYMGGCVSLPLVTLFNWWLLGNLLPNLLDWYPDFGLWQSLLVTISIMTLRVLVGGNPLKQE